MKWNNLWSSIAYGFEQTAPASEIEQGKKNYNKLSSEKQQEAYDLTAINVSLSSGDHQMFIYTGEVFMYSKRQHSINERKPISKINPIFQISKRTATKMAKRTAMVMEYVVIFWECAACR